MSYEEKSIKVMEIDLDQENPRFPPVANQRDAIQSMLDDQGDKIVNLASDIYQNGLNPSVRLIVFKNGARYIDGDGNRRLTAVKILETPSLADLFPKIRKRLDAILKKTGSIPEGVNCVVFKDRESARHWIAINHGGEQEGRGQINWNPEQKDRFERKPSIGLEALDLLMHKKLISENDKESINKSTLDRLLSYKGVKSKLSIQKNGDHFSFGNTGGLQKTVLALRDKKVDEVYTATKGSAFVGNILTPSSSGTNSIGNVGTQTDPRENSSDAENQTSVRSRRKSSPGLIAFGGTLSLKPGHVNNLYRDIEMIHEAYRLKNLNFSDDFIVIFRMSLRMLAETAAREIKKELKDFLIENFDQAKSKLDQNTKTSLANQSVEKGKIVQLFQTGAHDYTNSRNEEQALALSIMLGAILSITHRRSS